MATNEGIGDDESLGEWLHAELTERYGVETEAWARERVARASAALEAVRADCAVRGVCPHPLRAEILWVGAMTAFTGPGRYVYVTRELLQRADADDPIAFVLAHESAHHDLGHVQLLRGRLASLRRVPGRLLLGAALRIVERQVWGPEHERAADAYALDLCVAADFDPVRCLQIFDILEAHLLDHGDIDGVFGPDRPAAEPSGRVGRWLEDARTWGWQRVRGYPPLRERKADLLAQLERDYGVRPPSRKASRTP